MRELMREENCYPHIFHSPPALEEGSTGFPPYPHELQISGKASYPTGLNSPLQSAPIQAIRSQTSFIENSLSPLLTLERHEGVPPAMLEGPVYDMANTTGLNSLLPSPPIQGIRSQTSYFESPLPPSSMFSGHEGVPLASIKSPAYLMDIRANTTGLNSSLLSASIQEIRCQTSYSENPLPPSSTLLGHEGVPPASIEVPPSNEPADVDTAYFSHKDDTMSNSTVSSSLAAERRHSCDACGRHYSQRQGLLRHCREGHDNPQSCFSSHCKFKFTRPYVYKSHLEKQHPDVDPVTVLGKTAGSRRRTAIIARHPQQQEGLHSTTEHSGRSHSEIRPYPPVWSLPVVAKPSMVTPSAMLPITYVPGPESAQPTLMAVMKKSIPKRLEQIHSVREELIAVGSPVDMLAAHPSCNRYSTYPRPFPAC